jgi:small GTP-binding protein
MSKKESLYKILILGDSTVGKTCFLTRYADNTFQENQMATLGVDYKLKNIKMEDGNIVKLQIWDTAGQDRFHSLTRNYFKGAHGIILLYDITTQSSFDNVSKWIKQIKEDASEKVVIILVGNKIDLEHKRAIPTEEGEKIAEDFGLIFFECSAKTGKNINEAFNELIKKTVANFSKPAGKGQKLKQNRSDGSKGCC